MVADDGRTQQLTWSIARTTSMKICSSWLRRSMVKDLYFIILVFVVTIDDDRLRLRLPLDAFWSGS